MVYSIIVTCAGGAPSTGFIRSLDYSNLKLNITGVDANPYTLHRSKANRDYLVPFGSDSRYLAAIKKIVEMTNADFLHCQNSSEIEYISKYRDKIGVKTFLPSKESISICSDKYLSYQKWSEAGVPTPITELIVDKHSLAAAFARFDNHIWLRNIKGSAGRDSLVCTNFNQALEWINSHNGWGEFTAAEVLKKDSVTWMSIWKDGWLIAAQGRKRHYWEFANRAPSGVTGITGLGSTYSNSGLDQIAMDAIYAIDTKPNGIWSVDLTYDQLGIPNVTEINIGRFFTTVQFYTMSGCNFPEIYLKCAFDLELSFETPLLNPCDSNQFWLRGMDIKPKLISGDKINKYKIDYL